MAFFGAHNSGARQIVGTATFNVTPDKAGSYFNKIDCFCFTEQVLEPGQSAELPLNFFIDPAIVKDRDARGVTQVTVSYTFYPVAMPGVAEKSTGKPG